MKDRLIVFEAEFNSDQLI